MPSAASSRFATWLWRMAIVATLLAFAVLAIGSATDRMVTTRPEMAPKVPAIFASEALRSNGIQLLEAGEFKEAIALGEAAVSRDPVDPASTALLGAARFARGDRNGAERAFIVAGKLGWRIPLTQLYWMGRALEVGDFRVATLRLDALLRQKQELLKDRRLLDPIESDPRGRQALAQRLLANPSWLKAYTSEDSSAADLVMQWRGQTLIEMSRLDGSLGCETIAPIVYRLVRIGDVRLAHELWSRHCPAANRAIVFDGKFAAATVDQSRSEFNWFFIGQSDVEALPQQGRGLQPSGLAIQGNPIRDRFVVRQAIFAPVGKYRLSWRAENLDGTPTERILVSLGCDIEAASPVNATFDSAAAQWSAVVTLGDQCAAHWLKFGAEKGFTGGFLTDVALFPIK